MNKTDYNEYMLDLYKQCTFKNVSTDQNNGSTTVSQKQVDDLFAKSSSAFNNGMAIDFLTTISNKNPTILHKLSSFPYTFWRTPESTDQITLGINNFIESYTNKIDEKINDFKKNVSGAMEYESDVEYQQRGVTHAHERLSNALIEDKFQSSSEGILISFSKELVEIYAAFPAKEKLITHCIKTVSKHLTQSLENEKANISLIELNKFEEKLNYVFKDLPYKQTLDNMQLKTLLKSNDSPRLKY